MLNYTKRVYTFASRAEIAGARGAVHVEPISPPVKTCPRATLRVIARYAGKVPAGAPITVDERAYTVLKMFPSNARTALAYFLCEACA